jgi:hypothetical protein
MFGMEKVKMATNRSDSEEKFCHLCGEPAVDIICRHCNAKIQAEAAHKKQQIDRELKTDSSRK